MRVWDKTKEENHNQYAFFSMFLTYPDLNIKAFHDKLWEDEVEGLPAIRTMYNWSSRFNWINRKKAYIVNRSLDQRYRLEELNYTKKEEIFKAKHNLIINAINKCAEDFNDGKMTGSQFSQWVNGINGLLNDNRLDVLEATEIKDTKISADVDVNSESLSVFEKLKQIDEQLNKIDEGED